MTGIYSARSASRRLRHRRLTWMVAVVFLAAAVLLTACGGDDEGEGLKRPGGGAAAAAAARKKKKAKKRGKGRTLTTYAKVPDQFRPELEDKDFVPDTTGTINRDPFRSYVMDARRNTSGPDSLTDVCTTENSVATNYSLRDLRLIGIVLRGTRSYALFRDSGGYGHIVRRADCVGKEQARVENIGAGFVRLSVTAEAPPGAAAPSAQTRDILLYPEELSVDAIEGGPQRD